MAAQPALTFTGERRNRRLLVRIHAKSLWVSYGPFCGLVRLVLARGQTQSGFVTDPDVLYPVAVYRLRRAIDEAVEPGAGTTLIETGLGAEYRLAVPITDVALAPDFLEIAGVGVLAADELANLQGLCGPCHRDVVGDVMAPAIPGGTR
jgi:hypothetical protein